MASLKSQPEDTEMGFRNFYIIWIFDKVDIITVSNTMEEDSAGK